MTQRSGSLTQTGQLLSRRKLLQAAGMASALTSLHSGTAQADTEGLVVLGQEGWLYAAWDTVTQFNRPHFTTGVKVIGDACAILKRAGIEVVLAVSPSKSRIYREFLPPELKWAPEADKRYAAAMAYFSKSGVLMPDLASAFEAAHRAAPKTDLFFRTDTHWSPAGTEVAANEVGRQILASINLPPSEQPGKVFGDYVKRIQSKNNLADQLPPAVKAKYPKEIYTIRQENIADSGASLLADDAPDTVVIGNSYVQPKYMFSDYLSAALHRPIGLHWQVHAFGSYAILLEYLASKAFKTTRPKLIVWNFTETDMEAPPDFKDFYGIHAMPNDRFLSELARAVA